MVGVVYFKWRVSLLQYLGQNLRVDFSILNSYVGKAFFPSGLALVIVLLSYNGSNYGSR